jgi:hypothetical protein
MIEARILKGKNVKECTGGLIFCSQITVDVDSERKSYDSVWQPHSVGRITTWKNIQAQARKGPVNFKL